MIPGQILYADEPVRLNDGLPLTRMTVLNSADRPVQVGSHYHFAEANPGLDFDRAAAYGKRLNVAAGSAVRFEPGIPTEVELVPIGGKRIVAGLRGRTGGPLDVSEAREATGPQPWNDLHRRPAGEEGNGAQGA
ncbi:MULTISPECIES: urease subunit beta [unclassified Streptomyces]|uniref:urease subunit beta n=1 Tax=unclassified Streptomyces TaxID=2593676 RepID=UPI00037E550D|nr:MULTISPECIES: urease subunit beta [unclassified Streptomyces]MYT27458.1 urease subunit beta [Streptomyces sp. SID8354]